MRTTGIILLVFGCLSFLGFLSKGQMGAGPFVFIGIGCYLIHRSNQKKQEREEKQKWSEVNSNFSSDKDASVGNLVKIVNPAKDLTMDQKYAIMGLFAFIQGFSPHSAYSEEATEITKSTALSFGLTLSEVGSYLQSHPDNGDKLIKNLKSIRDRNFLDSIYKKCHTIARISLEREAEEVLDHIFRDLGYTHK